MSKYLEELGLAALCSNIKTYVTNAIPSAITASEASTGTATTARTITAKVLSDLINARISAITDGDGVSY